VYCLSLNWNLLGFGYGKLNVWHCFKCGRHGNALDLWCAATGELPYDAAVELCERLGLTLPLLEKSGTEEEERVAKEPIVA